MKAILQTISSNSLYPKAMQWGKLITITGGGQIVVQLTALLSGILIIRLLPEQEYALYTLVNTMLGTMTILADGGIAAGIMAKSGQVWQDRQKLGIVLSTGLDLRKRFGIVSLLIATPILVYFLIHHGASWIVTLLIILSLIPTFFATLSDSLLEIPVKLQQDIIPLQKNQVTANVGRLFLTTISIFIFPWAFIAILAGGIPRIWANIRLRKISEKYTDWDQTPDPAIRKDILAFVKRILPGAIYFCVSGQITIWLISIFGTTSAIAQIGALGRLAMVLGLFNSLSNTLISPRFSRLPAERKILLTRFIQIFGILVAICSFIILTVYLFPGPLLKILGSSYANLSSELLLNIIGSCIGLIAGIMYSLFTSRGWAINPILSIPINILSIIAGALLFDLTTLHGILYLNIFIVGVQLVMNGSYCLIKIIRTKSNKTATL